MFASFTNSTLPFKETEPNISLWLKSAISVCPHHVWWPKVELYPDSEYNLVHRNKNCGKTEKWSQANLSSSVDVSVQINKMCVLLPAAGSAFIVVCAGCWLQVGNVQELGFILREHGCAMSMDVLWPRYGCGLDVGHRHPSYWQKTVKKSLWLSIWNFKENYTKTLIWTKITKIVELLRKNTLKTLNYDLD